MIKFPTTFSILKLCHTLIILFMISPLHSIAQPVKTFNLMTANYPPYHYHDSNGKVAGLKAEIVISAFQASGYTVTTQMLPFSRALQYSKDGNADGMTLWHRNDREQYFIFSTPIASSQTVLYKHQSLKIDYQTPQDIIPFKIGTVQNYAYPEALLKNKSIHMDPVLSDEQNIKKLVAGRIDIALIDIRIAKFLMKQFFPSQIELFDSAGILNEEKYYLAISKKAKHSQRKLEDFNKGLKIIRNNGVLAEILARYNE